MKELMKGPNERGREDFENAISDDLETKFFKIFPLGANHGAGRGGHIDFDWESVITK
jgi:hypothetical protein